MPAARQPRLVDGGDRACVAAQLGRTPQAMSRVVARCPWGFPAAVENLPYDESGQPFPTLFYATCPTLVAAVAAVESGGGVKRYERLLQTDSAARASFLAAAAGERRRRRVLGTRYGRPMLDGGAALSSGVGGVAGNAGNIAAGAGTTATSGSAADSLRVKCLHAHAAHALARPGYALGRRVLTEAGKLWCNDCRCATTPSELS